MDALNEDPQHPKIHAFGRFPHRIGSVSIPGTRGRASLPGLRLPLHPDRRRVALLDPRRDRRARTHGRGVLAAQGRPGHPRKSLASRDRDRGGTFLDLRRSTTSRGPEESPPNSRGGEPAHHPRRAGRRREAESEPSCGSNGRAPHSPGTPRTRAEILAGCRPALFRFCGDFAYATVPITNVWGGISDFLDRVSALGTGCAKAQPRRLLLFRDRTARSGHRDWGDLGDRRQGICLVRWVGRSETPSGHPPTLESSVVAIDHIHDALPVDVPQIDPACREFQRAAHRTAHLRVMS